MLYKIVPILLISIIIFVQPSDLLQRPNNANQNSLFVELLIVVDIGVFSHFNRDTGKVENFCKDIVNIINERFNQVNVFVVLVDVIIWKEKNEIEFPSYGVHNILLNTFKNYQNEIRLKYPHDSAQLITVSGHWYYKSFAYATKSCDEKDSFCGYALFSETSNVNNIAEVLISNIALSFNNVTNSDIANWKNDEITRLNTFKASNTQCLRNLPHKTFQSPTCGNGFVEDDEECDCSLTIKCGNICCDPETCKLLAETCISVPKPFNANEQSLYVELLIVVDYGVFNHFNKDSDKANKFCKDVVKIVNERFNQINVFIALVDVVIWAGRNEIDFPNDLDVLLHRFKNYRNEIRSTKYHDNAQLITMTETRYIMSDAYRTESCDKKDSFCGYVRFFPNYIPLGHPSAEYYIAEFIIRNIAKSFNGVDNKKIGIWDSDEISRFNNFKAGNTRCLRNLPYKTFQSPTCGNGFVEADEECDCGTSIKCENLCCDPERCKLLSKTSCTTVLKPFNANEQSLYVELLIVVDFGVFNHFNKNTSKVQEFCKDLANIINSHFNQVNVFVVLVDVVIWSEKNEIEMSRDGYLDNFKKYQNEIRSINYPHDNAQLITTVETDYFQSAQSTESCDEKDSFCGYVVFSQTSNVDNIADVVISNIASSFHVVTKASVANWNKDEIAQFNRFKAGNTGCLKNLPHATFQSPTCGNGFVEDDEECDCGLDAICSNYLCCDSKTCKRSSSWQCDNGRKINCSKLCDGIRDCDDGSDETIVHCFGKTCSQYEFRCSYGGCIPKKAECNGTKDCFDGSDESSPNCPTKTSSELQGQCRGGEFQCDSDNCISYYNGFCNGKIDCIDGSDEKVEYCASKNCSSTDQQFRCANGACISKKFECDGLQDCPDGSDENYLLCGKKRMSPAAFYPCAINLTPRISFGTETKLYQHPWIALILHTYGWGKQGFHCSGSLISEKFVLTAAHCINELFLLYRGYTLNGVRLGEYNRATYRDCNGEDCTRTIDVPIQKIIPHPNYNLGNSIHDIALLRLKIDVEFTDSIKPICLPPVGFQQKNYENISLTVAGWGQNENGTTSDILMSANVTAISSNECKSKHKISLSEQYQLCAGGANGEGACEGDSGGPLIEFVRDGDYYYIVGVVQGGYGCTLVNIYTRVDAYLEWIRDNLK